MPTHFETDAFKRDWKRLTPDERAQFIRAMLKFRDDLTAQEESPSAHVRSSLRIKPYRSGRPGDLEFTFAGDGRAVFRYGAERVPGKKHVDWLRVGTHDIF